MSSSILVNADSSEATPMVWRRVDGPPRPATAAPAPAPADLPDPAAQVAQIEQQWQARVREAHAAGFREGEASGRKRGAADIQPVVEKLSLAMGELSRIRARLRQEAEADLIQLALAIARRILRREMAVDPEALRGLLRAALDRLQGQEISRVRVHPSQAALFTECLRNTGSAQAVEVIADPLRIPGDAIFETQHGNLDASVESQLQEIGHGLTDRLPKMP